MQRFELKTLLRVAGRKNVLPVRDNDEALSVIA